MSGRWELEFQGMPPGPNDRLHWRERARRTKVWRYEAMCRAIGHPAHAVLPMLQRVRLSATFTRRTLGRADEDNDRARLKPLVDGLVDAGVIPNDTRGHIEWGPCLEAKGQPGVRLIVEALEV